MEKENKILEILDLVQEKVLSPDEALPQILLLFSVSGRSEQVCPCGKLIKRYRPTPCPTNGITYCEDCIGPPCH